MINYESKHNNIGFIIVKDIPIIEAVLENEDAEYQLNAKYLLNLMLAGKYRSASVDYKRNNNKTIVYAKFNGVSKPLGIISQSTRNILKELHVKKLTTIGVNITQNSKGKMKMTVKLRIDNQQIDEVVLNSVIKNNLKLDI